MFYKQLAITQIGNREEKILINFNSIDVTSPGFSVCIFIDNIENCLFLDENLFFMVYAVAAVPIYKYVHTHTHMPYSLIKIRGWNEKLPLHRYSRWFDVDLLVICTHTHSILQACNAHTLPQVIAKCFLISVAFFYLHTHKI